ncbi:hypothetical protein CG434_23000 [Pantoea ananatis]|nr:hypothetical protein [Pantoea ananatis]NQE82171.1 hypothetical protein [Pantoea ananatis]PQK82833.1 hypothetical protein CG432_22905 [Pantoea ananatis]PQK85993.1 hypothetical protein CG433_23260 [Pantoea ananatis]PQK93883.1 hypothetical protein CG434_23000 [Pantoea ananatis]
MPKKTSSDAAFFFFRSGLSRRRAELRRRREGIKGRRQKVFAAPGEKFLAAYISPLSAGTGGATTSPPRKARPEQRKRRQEGNLQPASRAGHRATAVLCRGGESDGASRQQPLTLTFAIRLYTNPPAGSAELGGSAALAE